ncbi:MAG TPA: hypothetical protein VNJ10_01450 [Sphingomonas sp.]|nr:hypothetical protein [Sphingomonas sp.]
MNRNTISLTDHSDYDTDADLAPREPRSDEEWEGLWNVDDRNRDTMRKIEWGVAVIAAAVAIVVVRAGWIRVSSPVDRVVPSTPDIHVSLPSAADIHVSLPPLR